MTLDDVGYVPNLNINAKNLPCVFFLKKIAIRAQNRACILI